MDPLVLIVEDDADIAIVLRDRLTSMGYEAMTVSAGQAALDALKRVMPSLLLLDVQLPDPTLNGLAVLKHVRQEWPEMPVILMTAFGTIPMAVDAMKEGATDFVTKPFDFEHLAMVITRAMERSLLKREVLVLRAELKNRFEMVGSESPAMEATLYAARQAALSDSTVLLLGESGTGKDLLARAIHNESVRSNRLFMPVNCVVFPDDLLESELFGHERGAFTGAAAQKQGKLELANGGTVFLDEIGDMKLALQVKLLRFLQNREFERVGSTRTIRVDVRVIAATNRDLQQALESGAFREDLFYRLDVLSITLPPLRDRPTDIPALAEFFLKKFCQRMNKPALCIAPPAMKALVSHPWKGNIRELQNAIERAVALTTGTVLTLKDFSLRQPSPAWLKSHAPRLAIRESVEQHREEVIHRALTKTHGNQAKAADLLGLNRTYLNRLIKDMNLKKPPETP